MATWRAWTNTEERILRDMYPSSGMQSCLDLLPRRTEDAIRVRAYKLGLKHNRLWSEHEDHVLKCTYPVYGPHAAHAALPHRSVSSIYARAERLGYFRIGLVRGRPPSSKKLRNNGINS